MNCSSIVKSVVCRPNATPSVGLTSQHINPFGSNKLDCHYNALDRQAPIIGK